MGDKFYLITAFSREGSKKVYVQHRLKEHAKEVNELLQQKAYFYVCGDAANMAREVNSTLSKIISEQRSIPEAKAEEVVKSMRAANQYQVNPDPNPPASSQRKQTDTLPRRTCGRRAARRGATVMHDRKNRWKVDFCFLLIRATAAHASLVPYISLFSRYNSGFGQGKWAPAGAAASRMKWDGFRDRKDDVFIGGRNHAGGVRGLDRLSFLNLRPSHADRYWAHLVPATHPLSTIRQKREANMGKRHGARPPEMGHSHPCAHKYRLYWLVSFAPVRA
jgi:hypothetical protein